MLVDKGIAAITRSLQEFGYEGLEESTVREAYDRWKKGQPATSVIDMFAVKDFNERPDIFGTPDA